MMLRSLRLGLVSLLLLTLALTKIGFAQATRGAPGALEFGIGAILYPQGPLVDDALDMAVDLDLDWMEVPVTWAVYQPNPAAPAQLESLDGIMRVAAQNQIAVLVSISGAPDWARTSRGPDPQSTVAFVQALVQRYPQAIQAVELFPGANTSVGWGSQPDAADYMALFSWVNTQIGSLGHPVTLVAAGLQPVEKPTPAGDVNDLEFLQSLYKQGASRVMPVISVQYRDLTGDPLMFPDGSEQRVFRHYEEVRRVMSLNQHQNGLIWITHLSLPSGTISIPDSAFQDINAQSNWLSQAYIQTRSQLYVGVTIGQSSES